MKKVLMAAVIVAVGALTSCKKESNDYICTCNYYVIIMGPGVRVHEINDASLEEAKEECKQYQVDYTSLAGRNIDCYLTVE